MLLVAARAGASVFPAAVAGSITGQALPDVSRRCSGSTAAAASRTSASPLPRSLRVSLQHRRHEEDRASGG